MPSSGAGVDGSSGVGALGLVVGAAVPPLTDGAAWGMLLGAPTSVPLSDDTEACVSLEVSLVAEDIEPFEPAAGVLMSLGSVGIAPGIVLLSDPDAGVVGCMCFPPIKPFKESSNPTEQSLSIVTS